MLPTWSQMVGSDESDYVTCFHKHPFSVIFTYWKKKLLCSSNWGWQLMWARMDSIQQALQLKVESFHIAHGIWKIWYVHCASCKVVFILYTVNIYYKVLSEKKIYFIIKFLYNWKCGPLSHHIVNLHLETVITYNLDTDLVLSLPYL